MPSTSLPSSLPPLGPLRQPRQGGRDSPWCLTGKPLPALLIQAPQQFPAGFAGCWGVLSGFIVLAEEGGEREETRAEVTPRPCRFGLYFLGQ